MSGVDKPPEPEDYVKGAYAQFCDLMNNTQLDTIRDHIHHYSIESLLGFSYWLHRRVGQTYNDLEYSKSHRLGYFAHTTFTNNMVLCYSSFLALERGLYGPCAANMRPVLESIPKMFYLSYHPDKLLHVLSKDLISGIRDHDEKKRTLEEFRSQHPTYDDFDVDKMIEEVKKKYTFKYFLKAMYFEETASKIEKLYRYLNSNVHPSLLNNTYNYNKESTDMAFVHVKMMLFYNIAIEVDCHMQIKAGVDFPFKKSHEFLNRTGVDLSSKPHMYLLPDNPDLADAANDHLVWSKNRSPHT